MKNKPSDKTALEDFKNSHVFIMTRTSEDGNIGLTIQTDTNAKDQDELHELYHVTFYDVALNLGEWFNATQYQMILNVITPALASVFFSEFPERCQELISDYYEQEPNKKIIASLKKRPDTTSIVQYILVDYFKQFAKIKKQRGLDNALTEMGEFFQDMEYLFYKLPACYCFILGDLVQLWKKKK